jgi:toxin ParE1/3/4
LELVVHPAAEAEGREAWLRYRAIDPIVATRFLAALDRVMSQVAEHPDRSPVHVHGTRRALVRRFPFSVIYRADSSRILVVAIAHQRRRPDYWRRRTATR